MQMHDDPQFTPEERLWLTQSRGGGALGDVPSPVARRLIEVGFVRRTPTGLAVSQKGREWLVRHGFLHRKREAPNFGQALGKAGR